MNAEYVKRQKATIFEARRKIGHIQPCQHLSLMDSTCAHCANDEIAQLRADLAAARVQIEALTKARPTQGGDGKSGDDEDGMALLAEVEALEAELIALRREREAWRRFTEQADQTVDRAEAERDRYRAALTEIVDLGDVDDACDTDDLLKIASRANDIARRALADSDNDMEGTK